MKNKTPLPRRIANSPGIRIANFAGHSVNLNMVKLREPGPSGSLFAIWKNEKATTWQEFTTLDYANARFDQEVKLLESQYGLDSCIKTNNYPTEDALPKDTDESCCKVVEVEGSHACTIFLVKAGEGYPYPLVIMTASDINRSFTSPMTPSDARKLANVLMEAANEAEAYRDKARA